MARDPVAAFSEDLREALRAVPIHRLMERFAVSQSQAYKLRGVKRLPSRPELIELLEEVRQHRAAASPRPGAATDLRALVERYDRDVVPELIRHSSKPPAQPSAVAWGSAPPLASAHQVRCTALTSDPVPSSGSYVVSGMGGVGKSQLAAYAYHHSSAQVRLWVDASGGADAVLEAFAAAAKHLRVPGYAATSLPDRARHLLTWLSGVPSWVVVFDNAPGVDALEQWWPAKHSAGVLVVTTRHRGSSTSERGSEPIALDLFTPEESLAYVRHRVESHLASGELPPDALDGVELLAQQVGYLPLALAQAASIMINAGITAEQCRSQLAAGAMEGSEDASVTTWTLAVDEADRRAPHGLSAPVAAYVSMLDAGGAPASLLHTPPALEYLTRHRRVSPTEGNAELGPVGSDEAHLALRNLHLLSVLTHAPGQPHTAIRMHALMSQAVHETLDADTCADTVRAVADSVMAEWDADHTAPDGEAVLRANAHALQTRHPDPLWVEAAHPLTRRLGDSMGNAGLLAPAIAHFRSVGAEASARWGPGHPDAVDAHREAAGWTGFAGDPEQAVRELEDLLVLVGSEHGCSSERALAIRGEMAYWRRQSGDGEGALATFRTLLDDQVAVLGSDHPDVLATRIDLASCVGGSGDYVEAIRHFEQLLPDATRILGLDHPQVMSIRHELASWRGEAGDFVGAVAAFEALVPDRARLLGPAHPGTIASRNNLAYWRGESGDAAGAVREFAELIPLVEKVMGRTHVLATRHHLARWKGELGQVEEAITGLSEVLVERRQAHGQDHPRTLTTRHELARWRALAGDVEEAVQELRAVVAARAASLGEHHPETVQSRQELTRWVQESQARSD